MNDLRASGRLASIIAVPGSPELRTGADAAAMRRSGPAVGLSRSPLVALLVGWPVNDAVRSAALSGQSLLLAAGLAIPWAARLHARRAMTSRRDDHDSGDAATGWRGATVRNGQ